ncbi:protein IWS1 homolog A isoform X2 [Sesamum indicum]|uniref:Protein IWS1 homolog A isoform X2 n=1 Tax=Sesamum indicum TaxID=4182 RepID=A0A6I9TPY1_SESIN|nr:protein IWS1 homolog A isoform X2 [Sesamum indicum]
MAKRRREPDTDGTGAAAVEYGTVFVDTSLDTHLAMLVSNSDTVSDFKKKLALEHVQCFPKIGEIRIHSMKVKRRANLYHLPDNMIVWSAFHSVKRNWFLSADVSGIPEVGGVDDDCRALTSDANKIPALPMSLQDGVTEKNVVSEITAGVKAEKSLEKTTVSQSNNYSQENYMDPESRAKKKRKTRHTEDACHRPPSMRDSCTLDYEPGKDTSTPQIIACGNPMVDVVKEGKESMLVYEQQGKPTMSEATAEVIGVRNSQPDVGDNTAFEGTSSPATANKSHIQSALNSPNLLGSDKRKEDTLLESIIHESCMNSKQECELGHDVPTEHLGCVSNKVPNVSASLMDAGGAIDDVNSDGTGRKKKKAQKTAAKIQGATDTEHSRKGESLKPSTEARKSGRKKEEKGLSVNHDNEVILASYKKTSDHADPNLMLKEASTLPHLLDTNAVMEPEISSGRKKKKRAKKSADTNQEKSGIEQTDNVVSGSSGLLCASTDHIPEETDKEENILHVKGKNVQVKILDTSTTDAIDKVPTANRNEANFMILTQTKQCLEDVASGKEEVEEKTKHSASNCHADMPAKEKEYHILEFNQVEKNSDNTEDKDNKAKKKRKKRNPTESDIQESLPVKDQKVGVVVSTTKEESIGFVNTALEAGDVASSQVLSCRSQEKLEEMHGGAADHAGDLARTSEHEGEGINFKQYFVPGQYQDKADSTDRVKKGTKSNVETKNGKKVRDNGLPPVSNSTELQNSAVKSLENLESEKKSRVKKTSGMRPGDSAQNSDREDVIPNSITRSLRVSGKRTNDSSPSGMLETTSLQKPNEILAKSSSQKEKNTSLDKSSSKRSEAFHEKRGNKILQSGLSATHKMAMKTPQKKSLFNKSGTIFQDNSGESSGDENDAVHSDASTLSPSDSSSLSSYSVGESDLSQDSTGNGSDDAKGRSTGGKSTSKLDISASKDMTMDMILKSSKRFKKAKLHLSSQNEFKQQHDSQPMEFVPDSQPT